MAAPVIYPPMPANGPSSRASRDALGLLVLRFFWSRGGERSKVRLRELDSPAASTMRRRLLWGKWPHAIIFMISPHRH